MARVAPSVRRCVKCGETKPAAEFYCHAYTTNQGKRSKRYHSACKSCDRATRQAKHLIHKDRYNARSLAWKHRVGYSSTKVRAEMDDESRARLRAGRCASEARRRRAIEGGADATVYERVLEDARFGDRWLDAYTGDLITDPTIDHIVPLSKGGAHEYENLCVTSKSNNCVKKDRSMLVWMALR